MDLRTAPLLGKNLEPQICARPQASPPKSAPKRILVVDQSACLRELIALHLSHAGHSVVLAEDAVSAGHLVVESAPDLMIIGAEMPYMSGFEFVSALRADKSIPAFPVIFLTADQDFSYRADTLGADCLAGPIRADELLAAVARQS